MFRLSTDSQMSQQTIHTQMPNTLATVAPKSGTVSTEMTVIDTAAADANIMPPGFSEPVNRPLIFIGGETENGPCFYQWDRQSESRNYVPVNRFSASLIELKTVIKNADNELTRAVKLIAEFETPTGQRVAMSCGANTYSALGFVSGLSACTDAELGGEIGISARSGKNGKVTFVSVFANGQLKRNPNSEDLLKESKQDGVMVDALQGYVTDINTRLQALNAA